MAHSLLYHGDGLVIFFGAFDIGARDSQLSTSMLGGCPGDIARAGEHGRIHQTHQDRTTPPVFELPVVTLPPNKFDANKTVHNQRLRHDINFDPDFHFTLNFDDEKRPDLHKSWKFNTDKYAGETFTENSEMYGIERRFKILEKRRQTVHNSQRPLHNPHCLRPYNSPPHGSGMLGQASILELHAR